MSSKFNSFYYWDNLIENEEKISNGNFKDFIPKKDSVYAHCAIVNCDGNSYNSWICYPNVKSLMGFFQYVFLPTAYNTKILGHSIEEISISNTPIDYMIKQAIENRLLKDANLIESMNESYYSLIKLWDFNENESFDKFKNYIVDFNNKWLKEEKIFFYFNIFKNPLDIKEKTLEVYEKFDELDLYNRLGMDKEQWVNMCNEYYENDLIRKFFVNKLNTYIKDIF